MLFYSFRPQVLKWRLMRSTAWLFFCHENIRWACYCILVFNTSKIYLGDLINTALIRIYPVASKMEIKGRSQIYSYKICDQQAKFSRWIGVTISCRKYSVSLTFKNSWTVLPLAKSRWLNDIIQCRHFQTIMYWVPNSIFSLIQPHLNVSRYI